MFLWFFFSNGLHNCTSLLHCKTESIVFSLQIPQKSDRSVVPRPLTPRGVNENSIQKHTHFRVTSANLLFFFFQTLKGDPRVPGSCVRIQRGRQSLGAVILFHAEKKAVNGIPLYDKGIQISTPHSAVSACGQVFGVRHTNRTREGTHWARPIYCF